MIWSHLSREEHGMFLLKYLPFPFLFLLLWFCTTWCLEPSSAWHHGCALCPWVVAELLCYPSYLLMGLDFEATCKRKKNCSDWSSSLIYFFCILIDHNSLYSFPFILLVCTAQSTWLKIPSGPFYIIYFEPALGRSFVKIKW